ncbi:MAG: cysteine sulfinate desulfinase [Deltaproteobacteria bacterium RIFCSPLOWO2_12_FULL_40_28]|nr:MAG: cysteine sulfinate desulfinase [Deltaproteobacteria bacterium RIFCSPHIGHO2_02_FULL_40_28]OGQ19298.1 MAG: cysteine sulfinate desulfinase [Deltaproteobacteria bacterium RIFCSPHIGHO2_12_FULL_40_32]OGQ40478.1 MAG: cysteine sulfinate desulfinase [Deltaproteobacteria bacterium RIFCSPLOWO2_02_FULL_40_36]OGQ53714.1 MAG: cysteine sulfinate desulfinase [Deltaproteobacteria bacterium RIFCSPLOWO2_12_FULL_40_28]
MKKFDPHALRREFPIFNRKIFGKPLTYLDSAASAQKPRILLESLKSFFENHYANIHRGVYLLSFEATEMYEAARNKVAQYLGTQNPKEIVFVRGATEGINLVATCFGKTFVHEGDEILISHLEHHSNIVPWQMMVEERGAHLKVIPINQNGDLDLEAYQKLLTKKTRMVAVTHVSNALGTVNPIRTLSDLAHKRGAKILVDGAQALAHAPTNVCELDCDFYVFSGHKLYGPNGIGAVYGKKELWEKLPPYQGGGDMIESVTFEKTTYAHVPQKFEAGTPNIAGAIGLGAVIDFLKTLDWESIKIHEKNMVDLILKGLAEFPQVKLIGMPTQRMGVVSFVIDAIHPHDIGTILDREGIAIRAGHHCAQPLMDFFKIPATVRASVGIYTTPEDIQTFIVGIKKVLEVFKL